MSITPPPLLQPQADFETDPSTSPNPFQKPTYPRTSPPARAETPPTPELTFASIFTGTSHTLWEAKAPPPLDLPPSLALSLYPSPTPTHAESNHGSSVDSPYATSFSSSSSSRSSGSGFESISLRSLSSEALVRLEADDDDDPIRPPAPAFLLEHNGVGMYTQGRMIWRPTLTTYVPYPRGVGLPFAIIEEEEPPEEPFDRDNESEYNSDESGSVSGQEGERVKAEVGESGSEESGFDDRKARKRRSLGKRIKQMFAVKRDAVRLGLKV